MTPEKKAEEYSKSDNFGYVEIGWTEIRNKEKQAFIAGWLAGQKPEYATGLKKSYDILCGELTQLKAGGSYKDTSGYADAIWDLKMILKDDYGIDMPEFKNWQPSPPTGAEPGEDQEGLWDKVTDRVVACYNSEGSVNELYTELKSKFIIHRKG